MSLEYSGEIMTNLELNLLKNIFKYVNVNVHF